MVKHKLENVEKCWENVEICEIYNYYLLKMEKMLTNKFKILFIFVIILGPAFRK